MNRTPKIKLVAVLIMIVCIVLVIPTVYKPEVKSILSSGVVATVDNIQKVGDNKWTIKVSLVKEDGMVFDDNVEVGNIELSPLNEQSFSSYYDKEISNDRKVINYLFNIQSNTHIKGIEIGLENLIVAKQENKIMDESIYDMYNTDPLKDDYQDEMSPIADIDNFHIIGVGFSSDYDTSIDSDHVNKELLCIQTKLITLKNGINNVAGISGLYNELTKQNINWFQGSTTPDNSVSYKETEEHIEIEKNYYPLTNTEKLKYIKPVVEYTLKKVINDGNWIMSVKF